MTEREAFRVGFLKSCADRGMSIAETQALVKTAFSWGDLVGTSAGAAAALGIVAPVGVGLAGGALVGGAVGQSDARDADELKDREMIDAFRRESQKAQIRNMLAKRQREAKPRSYRSSLI